MYSGVLHRELEAATILVTAVHTGDQGMIDLSTAAKWQILSVQCWSKELDLGEFQKRA